MVEITDKEFEKIVAEAMDSMPERYIKNMQNVAFVVEDEPTQEQRRKMMLRRDQTLFGLFEGIPLTQRGAGYNLVLPDKITIFKNPIAAYAPNLEALKKQVRHTVWHEIAHHFGLNHKRIHEVEKELGISQHF